jgi:hypothetical protein
MLQPKRKDGSRPFKLAHGYFNFMQFIGLFFETLDTGKDFLYFWDLLSMSLKRQLDISLLWLYVFIIPYVAVA